MTGILVTPPPPELSHDRIKKFKILEATLRRIKASRAFPKAVPCYDDWAPERTANGVKQWDDVHNKWKKPTWDDDNNKATGETTSDKDTASDDTSKETTSEEAEKEDTVSQISDTKDFQTQFVKLWANTFKWDETLSSIAHLPDNMSRRFKEVFVAAPLMTK